MKLTNNGKDGNGKHEHDSARRLSVEQAVQERYAHVAKRKEAAAPNKLEASL